MVGTATIFVRLAPAGRRLHFPDLIHGAESVISFDIAGTANEPA
jgi:hypothetical protein